MISEEILNRMANEGLLMIYLEQELAKELLQARQRIMDLEEQVDVFEDGLNKIKNWSIAYPLDIFPEPDLKKARELLKTGGIPLDEVTAHAMRHVVEGVGRIAREALDRGETKKEVKG